MEKVEDTITYLADRAALIEDELDRIIREGELSQYRETLNDALQCTTDLLVYLEQIEVSLASSQE